jgi:hypothetical protein
LKAGPLQGDQMGLLKIAQNTAQPIFYQNYCITVIVEIRNYICTYLEYLQNFQKLPKVSNRPRGEKSPNLFTLDRGLREKLSS